MNQRRLGHYALQDRLGHGAVGETWKAFDTLHQRVVAVKLVAVTPENSDELLQQSLLAAALHHPHIVPVQECFLSANKYELSIVMDYIEGQSLADYLEVTARTGAIPPPAEIVRMMTPIASALDYAHQQHIVHSGLKPSVVVFDMHRGTAPGEPMLVHFGLHARRDLRTLPLEDAYYIAPEVAQGNASTPRSDLYALGVMLYELCTGALPFQGDTASDVLMQHLHGAPTSPTLINPYIRPALTSVIMRSLSRDPAARFASATALVAAVAKAVQARGAGSVSQPMPALPAAQPSTWSESSGALDAANSPTYLIAASAQDAATAATQLTPSQPLPAVAPRTPVISSASLPTVATTTPQLGTVPPVLVGATPARRRRRIPLWVSVLIVLLLVVLIGSGILVTLTLARISATNQQTALVGHAFFASSGLISELNNEGITDQLHVALQNIPDPHTGMRYYGWLMSTALIDTPALALGALTVTHGQLVFTYTSAQHNNLLANYSRFLITEEDASQQPTNPSFDKGAWSYYAAFSTVASQTDPKKYSLLDHLRHLLSQDPKLHDAGIPGGLDVWLYRNTSKIVEAAGSARDTQKLCVKSGSADCTSFVLRQVARILDYLDGATYVLTENIPQTIQGQQLLIDPVIARVALLEFDPVHQQPPGYLNHIGTHLENVSQIPSSTPDQRALALHINADINNVQGWLDDVHTDAAKLIHMSVAQLLEPATSTILNDLFSQANAAFVGQVDPNTNSVKEGVVQIHYNIQSLATFDIAPCTMINGQSSCV